MTATDTITAMGSVAPRLIDLSTGKTLPWGTRHNAISHEASTSMATAFAGDLSRVPNRIGLIYGPNANPAFPAIGREQSWSSLETDLRQHTANVQLQPFSCTPTLSDVSTGQGESATDGKAVTFHAHSDSATHGFFNITGVGDFTSSGSKYIYQAVLVSYYEGDYKVLARVSLKNGSTYSSKPSGFEIALDWTIKFF